MLERISLFFTALIGLVAGGLLMTDPQAVSPSLLAYSSTMPESPVMVYVGNAGETHGSLTEEDLVREGVMIVRDWQAARELAAEQPLDALLMDSGMLSALTDDDKAWLQSHLPMGVIMGGFGIDRDIFARSLGLETLRSPGEADVPVRADEVIWIHALILGHPEDVALLQSHNWLARSFVGESLNIPGVQAFLNTLTGKDRQQLTTAENVSFFFKSLRATIEGVYERRSAYQQTQKASDEESQ